MMFNQKNKKIFKRAWAVMAAFIIISMIMLYSNTGKSSVNTSVPVSSPIQ